MMLDRPEFIAGQVSPSRTTVDDGSGRWQVPPDYAARSRITSDLQDTLFVQAGAGSGKTSELVARVLRLVLEGDVELRSIAAITFTEKAGDELRDRIRTDLQKIAAADPPSSQAGRCRKALDQLDGAAIGTLHSFAQRLLTQYPIEARLPPRIEVLDEVSSTVAFDERWSIFQERLLGDPAMQRTLLLLFSAGVRVDALRLLARKFDDNWDLVIEQVPAEAAEPPDVRQLLPPVLDAMRAVCGQPCRASDDSLRVELDKIADYYHTLCNITDEHRLIEAISPNRSSRPTFSVVKKGRKASWDDIDLVRGQVAEVREMLDAVRQAVMEACARQVGSVLRAFTLEAAEQRRAAGQLQFHDLLVLARSLLRDVGHGRIRADLHERYKRILLDEFQDTDPIQIELAVRIATEDPESSVSGGAPWYEVEVTPGQLFFVGDPKQSIYRFRRADIETYLAAARRFGSSKGGMVELASNFRTTAPVIDWVNQTFGPLFHEQSDIDNGPSQPDYGALEPVRASAPAGPAVSVIGRPVHPSDLSADDLREAEAEDVAQTVRGVIGEEWSVDDERGGWRPARLGDITVLVPARTSLPFLEDALERHGIPFRTESSSLVYATRAVRDLLMILRAVGDPTNSLHTFSALRTPLLGCGDDDLYRFKVMAKGRWSYLARQPESVADDDQVRQGLEYLRRLYDVRQWHTPSELLDRIAEDRRAFELGFGEGRPRDVWRRLRFLIDQARAWSEATGGNLRQYLDWVDRQAQEGTRASEAVLPESDDDAVRIMTVHAAKGLEFPVTILSGMSTKPQGARAPAEVRFPPRGEVGYKFGSKLVTDEYSVWQPIDEQMDLQERIRLLYVACTRARDHLVVSVHRKSRKSTPAAAARTNAELLVEGMGEVLERLPDGNAGEGRVPRIELPALEPVLPFPAWEAERASALQKASRPSTVAATALSDEGTLDSDAEPDPGLAKRPRDLDLPPWLKGRYGTAVGRAVHAVLQTVDLATGSGLGALVAAQCQAEAIPERSRDVEQLARAALDSALVREAASVPHWREVYVCTPLEDRLIEGYIDLLYRRPTGLVIVDYKTSMTTEPEELDRRVALYQNQGASYALAVTQATGEPVAGVAFLFLTAQGAIERSLPNRDLAMAHARQLIVTGHELVAT